jgi:hypothetical protein
MAYILFSLVFISLIAGTGTLRATSRLDLHADRLPVLYLTRERWTAYLPARFQDVMYSRLPTTFMGDVEGGFTSADFDLTSNITEGDSRQGLDPKSKREIQRIMKVRGIGFDEARKVYMERSFKKAGIGNDGIPNDPKFVSFS